MCSKASLRHECTNCDVICAILSNSSITILRLETIPISFSQRYGRQKMFDSVVMLHIFLHGGLDCFFRVTLCHASIHYVLRRNVQQALFIKSRFQ